MRYVLIVLLVLGLCMIGCVSSTREVQPALEDGAIPNETPTVAVVEVNTTKPPPEVSPITVENTSWVQPSLEPTIEDPRTVVMYFYSSTCFICRSIENDTLRIEAGHNDTYRWVRINVYQKEGAALYTEYFNRSGLGPESRMVPLAYVRNETFVSKRQILEDLRVYLEEN